MTDSRDILRFPVRNHDEELLGFGEIDSRDLRPNRWQTGDVSFQTDLPCPRCGIPMVMGFYYLSQRGTHQHTHYVCLSWPHPGEQCGWHGWTVPSAPAAPVQSTD